MKNLSMITIASTFFLFSVCVIRAQDDENRLARPEWQLRADLEFQLACQKAKDKLCREIVRSIDTESESGSQQLLLKELAALLEISNDQVPVSLPLHEASSSYVENRKAAVIAWLKTYKAKGRELSKAVLDRERAFATEQAERLMGIAKEADKVKEPKKTSSVSRVDSSDLRSKIIEIDKLFRESAKEFTSAKTTADKHDALNKHAEIFRKWGDTQDVHEWEFEVLVTDVVKQNGNYVATTKPPMLLEGFIKGGQPLVVSNGLAFELADDQRMTITVGDTLLVTCKIHVRVQENRPVRQQLPVLFSLQVTEGTLGRNLGNVVSPFQIDFMMDAIEITIVEVKKEKQTNPSRTPIPTRPPIRKK